jgi:hypothetical protein
MCLGRMSRKMDHLNKAINFRLLVFMFDYHSFQEVLHPFVCLQMDVAVDNYLVKQITKS